MDPSSIITQVKKDSSGADSELPEGPPEPDLIKNSYTELPTNDNNHHIKPEKGPKKKHKLLHSLLLRRRGQRPVQETDSRWWGGWADRGGRAPQ